MLSKGYPQQMVEWCRDKITALTDDMAEAQVAYNAEVIKTVTTASEAELQEAGTAMDSFATKLDEKLSAWKKGAGVEIKKLAS